MATTNDTSGAHAEELPGYGAWLDEMDRDYWLGALRQAALAHYGTLHCICGESGHCEHCRLSEALAYTEDPDAEVWHDDDVLELAVDGDVLDLAELDRECRLIQQEV